VLAERRKLRADTPERSSHPVGHGGAGALRRRGRGAVAATEADATRQLVGERVDLLLRAFDAARVVEALRLRQLGCELRQPRPVGGLSASSKRPASVASAPRDEATDESTIRLARPMVALRSA
jgi:hypothetical protein